MIDFHGQGAELHLLLFRGEKRPGVTRHALAERIAVLLLADLAADGADVLEIRPLVNSAG